MDHTRLHVGAQVTWVNKVNMVKKYEKYHIWDLLAPVLWIPDFGLMCEIVEHFFTLLHMEFVFLNVLFCIFRSQMGCVVLDDFLYVLGGTNRHNEVLQVRYTLRGYEPQSTQSGNGHFLAYIPSWWKISPAWWGCTKSTCTKSTNT